MSGSESSTASQLTTGEIGDDARRDLTPSAPEHAKVIRVTGTLHATNLTCASGPPSAYLIRFGGASSPPPDHMTASSPARFTRPSTGTAKRLVARRIRGSATRKPAAT